MKYALLALVALTTTVPAVAADAIRTVAADGRTISYVVQPRDDGSYVLASAPREARSFRLRVKNGWVVGDVDGTPVSFRTPRTKADRTSAD